MRLGGDVAHAHQAPGDAAAARHQADHRVVAAVQVAKRFAEVHEAPTLGIDRHPGGVCPAQAVLHALVPGQFPGEQFRKSPADQDTGDAFGKRAIP